MKHKVTFEMAKTVFYDDVAVQFFDEERSFDEQRFFLGLSSNARLLLVCHCATKDGDVIRIISARKATISKAQNYRSE